MFPAGSLDRLGAMLGAHVCLVAHSVDTGHRPDLSVAEDVATFSAGAVAYVNVARLAAPMRIGAALGAVPWVQTTHIVDKCSRRACGGPEVTDRSARVVAAGRLFEPLGKLASRVGCQLAPYRTCTWRP